MSLADLATSDFLDLNYSCNVSFPSLHVNEDHLFGIFIKETNLLFHPLTFPRCFFLLHIPCLELPFFKSLICYFTRWVSQAGFFFSLLFSFRGMTTPILQDQENSLDAWSSEISFGPNQFIDLAASTDTDILDYQHDLNYPDPGDKFTPYDAPNQADARMGLSSSHLFYSHVSLADCSIGSTDIVGCRAKERRSDTQEKPKVCPAPPAPETGNNGKGKVCDPSENGVKRTLFYCLHEYEEYSNSRINCVRCESFFMSW